MNSYAAREKNDSEEISNEISLKDRYSICFEEVAVFPEGPKVVFHSECKFAVCIDSNRGVFSQYAYLSQGNDFCSLSGKVGRKESTL